MLVVTKDVPGCQRCAAARVAVIVAAIGAAGCRAPSSYDEVRVDFGAAAPREPRPPDPETPVLRMSVVAMLSPRDTHSAYWRLCERIGERLGTRVELVQRRTYREINDLLVAGSVDVAFLCTGGYLEIDRRAPAAVEILAVPVIGGQPTYRSYIIVSAGGAPRTVEDLALQRFAYTDELSLSGHDYATHLLRSLGRDPQRFFARTIFTRSHDRSVMAVSRGLVDGASVDGVIYDQIAARDPEVARHTRVIHRSPPFGAPPVVASTRLPEATRARLREVLLGLDGDPGTAAALRAMHIDRFTAPAPGLYDGAAAIRAGR